jgi:hypothetical protein
LCYIFSEYGTTVGLKLNKKRAKSPSKNAY